MAVPSRTGRTSRTSRTGRTADIDAGLWGCLLLLALMMVGCRSTKQVVATQQQAEQQMVATRDSVGLLERQQRRVVEMQWWGDTLPLPKGPEGTPPTISGGYRITYLDESLSQHREGAQAMKTLTRQESAENYLLQQGKSTRRIYLGLALGLTLSLLLILVGRRIKKQLFY